MYCTSSYRAHTDGNNLDVSVRHKVSSKGKDASMRGEQNHFSEVNVFDLSRVFRFSQPQSAADLCFIHTTIICRQLAHCLPFCGKGPNKSGPGPTVKVVSVN